MQWQQGVDLPLDCTVDVDLAEAATLLGFDPVGTASIIVEWVSDSTRLRENCGRFPLGEHVALEVDLPGDRIGGKVSLRRRIVTDGAITADDPFAPAHPGSILWEDRTDFRVEGSGPQFPVVTSSFRGAGLDERAAWAVRVPGPRDLIDGSVYAEPASEHVSVRLNNDHPLARRIASPADGDELAVLALGQVACELARGLVELATSEAFSRAEYEPGTLGALVSTILDQLGVDSPDALLARDSEEIAAIIQGRFLLWEGNRP